MKEFKNVRSKLYAQTKEWVANEKETNKRIKPKSQYQKVKPPISKQNQLNNNNIQNIHVQAQNNIKDNQSLFDKYYEDKLKAKQLNQELDKHEQYTQDKEYEENIYNNLYQQQQPIINKTPQPLEYNSPPYVKDQLTDEEIKDAAFQQLLEDYNNGKFKLEDLNNQPSSDQFSNINNNKPQIKEPTPTIKDAPLILPKIQKNYLLENKKLISEHKIQPKYKPKQDQPQSKHKDYGKTPEYLEKYKKEAEIKKEIIRKHKEEQKYPKGTKLLSEEERVTTLNSLINTKKEIQNLLEKMPITNRTKAIQSKKEELEHKMDEIEKAIEMFSRKQVFIKIE
jgi:hypothetical protein